MNRGIQEELIEHRVMNPRQANVYLHLDYLKHSDEQPMYRDTQKEMNEAWVINLWKLRNMYI